MNITMLGVDLAKNVFRLHGVDKYGKAVLKKTIIRNKLSALIAALLIVLSFTTIKWLTLEPLIGNPSVYDFLSCTEYENQGNIEFNFVSISGVISFSISRAEIFSISCALDVAPSITLLTFLFNKHQAIAS